MRKNILMSFDEPTDLELHELMVEVAEEAKLKAIDSQKKLAAQIAEQVIKAGAKFKAIIE